MPSRTEQKADARERRLEQERATARQAQRTRRTQLLTGTVAIAAAVIAVVIAISVGGGGAHGGLVKGASAHRLSAQVDSMLAGIPEHGTTLGTSTPRTH